MKPTLIAFYVDVAITDQTPATAVLALMNSYCDFITLAGISAADEPNPIIVAPSGSALRGFIKTFHKSEALVIMAAFLDVIFKKGSSRFPYSIAWFDERELIFRDYAGPLRGVIERSQAELAEGPKYRLSHD